MSEPADSPLPRALALPRETPPRLTLVERLDVPPNEASSTAVRNRVIAGEPPGPMVSAAVAA